MAQMSRNGTTDPSSVLQASGVEIQTPDTKIEMAVDVWKRAARVQRYALNLRAYEHEPLPYIARCGHWVYVEGYGFIYRDPDDWLDYPLPLDELTTPLAVLKEVVWLHDLPWVTPQILSDFLSILNAACESEFGRGAFDVSYAWWLYANLRENNPQKKIHIPLCTNVYELGKGTLALMPTIEPCFAAS
jgi:hypothetical protein